MPLTLSLELEWELRVAYRLSTEAVVNAFEALLGVGHLPFEQAERLQFRPPVQGP